MTNKIVVSELRDHIRNREMWTGKKDNPKQVIEEVLDNAFDEVFAGHATKITFDTPIKGNFIISDNGRGIPIHDLEIKQPDGSIFIKDSVVVAFTIPLSGTKFNTDNYEISNGQNGVGLVLVTHLSKEVHCYIRNNENKTKVFHYYFKDGEFVSKTEENDNEDYSTKVDFTIDETCFETIDLDLSYFEKRINFLNILYPNIKCFFNQKLLEKETIENLAKNILNLEKFYYIKKKFGNEEIFLYFNYSDNMEEQPYIFGEVNTKFPDGSYLSSITLAMFNEAKKIINNDNVSKSDFLKGFRLFVSLKIKEPKFDSQIKTKLVSNVGYLIDLIRDDLYKIFKTDDFKLTFEMLAEIKSLESVSKSIKKRKRFVNSKISHASCLPQKEGDVLYILEGESAAGTLLDVCNKKVEGVLGTFGKIPNILNYSLDQALSSEKLQYIFDGMGFDVDKFMKNQKQKYKYKKFKIICDADNDGLHISVLVSLFFWKYFPDLISEDRVYIIFPPLYKAVKNNEFKPIYTEKERIICENQNYNITRFKGLGEMNPVDMKTILNKENIKEFKLELPLNKEEEENLISSLKDIERKRELCNDYENYNFEKMLEMI